MQKQLPRGVLQNGCPKNFRKTHRKTAVLESLISQSSKPPHGSRTIAPQIIVLGKIAPRKITPRIIAPRQTSHTSEMELFAESC